MGKKKLKSLQVVQLSWKVIKNDGLCLGKLYNVLFHWPQKCAVQMYIVCVSLEDQSYGIMMCVCNRQRIHATIHRELVHQISGLYKYAQQQFNKWNRMHVHVTMFVSVCISTRQVYCMPHPYKPSGMCKCTVHLSV